MITKLPWTCNFENGMCGFVNDVASPGTFHWRSHSGITKSKNTGPDPADGQGLKWLRKSYDPDKLILFAKKEK